MKFSGVMAVLVGLLATSAIAAEDGAAASVGSFRRRPVENGWHQGQISKDDGGRLVWTNQAGVAWSLTPTPSGEALETGPRNPYRAAGKTRFELVRNGDRVLGFWFGSELYLRDGVDLKTQQSGGLKGYISASIGSAPPGYGHGVSFYVSVWSLLDEPLAGFQIGLPSTWIIPENRGFDQPLCPPGTVARDQWPERGPTWRDVFQTIEGGLGFWVSTQFPSAIPKYRMNGTSNGYNHEISSPGWGFGKTKALLPNETGIAQLSQRLLVPPDGITFEPDSVGETLGNAWMALPLVPAQTVDGTPAGDQCWTLFFNSASFRGPVAFWIPDTWSQLSKRYPVIHGRGLDARPGVMSGGAMEIDTVPFFSGHDGDGTLYSKIPQIGFPVDDEGRTILMQDVAFYSKATLAEAILRWYRDRTPMSGRFSATDAHRPALRARPLSLRQGRENLPLAELESVVETTIFEFGGSQAFGLRWKKRTDSSNRERLPEYWRRRDDRLVPVSSSEVPADTQLLDQTFRRRRDFPSYEPPRPIDPTWQVTDRRLGPFTADLSDGSRVTYAWFRFIDQPALSRVAWTKQTRKELQALVEEMHRNWPIDGEYLPNPSHGRLAEFDPAQLVTPPEGFEIGYVPIALSQERIPPK